MPTLYCPRCMAKSEMRLNVTDSETLSCPECDAETSVPDLEALIEGWAVVLPWLRQCAKIAPTAAPATV